MLISAARLSSNLSFFTDAGSGIQLVRTGLLDPIRLNLFSRQFTSHTPNLLCFYFFKPFLFNKSNIKLPNGVLFVCGENAIAVFEYDDFPYFFSL